MHVASTYSLVVRGTVQQVTGGARGIGLAIARHVAALDVNVSGALNVTRAAVAHWLDERSPARVVNFTSTAGLEGIPGMFAYATSKAAIVGLTLATANPGAMHGITANAIAPNAATRTAIRGQRERALEVRNETGGWPTFEGMEIESDHVAPLCAYLLSPSAPVRTRRR